MYPSELHPEQQYVLKIAKKLGADVKLLKHDRETVSCQAKLDLLKENHRYRDWTLDRIVKAVYFRGRNGSEDAYPYIGIITPEYGENINQGKIISQVLGISRSKALKHGYYPDRTPRGMSWGTCTPFPLDSSMDGKEREISSLIVFDVPGFEGKDVDVSIGGRGEDGLTTSMQLPYDAIYAILKEKFHDKIHLYKKE